MRGQVSFREALVSRYGESFIMTLVERLLMYAVGREVQYEDMPVVRAVTAQAARNDYRWMSLILDVVMSPPFQMRKAA